MAVIDRINTAFTGTMAVIKIGGITISKIQEISYTESIGRMPIKELGRIGATEAPIISFEGKGTAKLVLSDPNYFTAANNINQVTLNQYNSMPSGIIDNEVLETSWIINDPNRVDIVILRVISNDYDATTHKPLGGVDGNKFSINANNLDGIGKNAGLQEYAIIPRVFFTSNSVSLTTNGEGVRNIEFIFLEPVKMPQNQPVQ